MFLQTFESKEQQETKRLILPKSKCDVQQFMVQTRRNSNTTIAWTIYTVQPKMPLVQDTVSSQEILLPTLQNIGTK